MVESTTTTSKTTVFVVGRMGMGKTTMTNLLTGKSLATSGGSKGCTTKHQKAENDEFEVHDTPGDGDP